MENTVVGQETQEVQEVNYNNLAKEQVDTMIKSVDFSVFYIIVAAVIAGSIGATVGITALKKGYSWIIGFIKRM